MRGLGQVPTNCERLPRSAAIPGEAGAAKLRAMKNFTKGNRVLGSVLALSLLGFAAAEDVTPAVRAEANALARQYTGQVCRSDYELDTDTPDRRWSAAQIRSERTKLYNEWSKDLAEDARKDGGTYQVGYHNNRVWAWTRDRKGEREFMVVTLSATGKRELSCDL